MSSTSSLQQFGDDWTKEKLEIFTKYLEAYLNALKNRKFKKIYIDAFAGTGEIETNVGELVTGSAKIALSTSTPFDHYYFIELNKKKCKQLEQMIKSEYPHLVRKITILSDDSNTIIEKLTATIDWRYNRGLIFLDPYATQVKWSTLERIANTKALDLWYLFPFSALNRMLKTDGKIDESWEQCIFKILGSYTWKDELYVKDEQLSFFDSAEQDRFIKDSNTEKLKDYIINRLKTIFPGVSEKPKVLKNEKNSPLFLLCFAVSNPSDKAIQLALRIANHILSD